MLILKNPSKRLQKVEFIKLNTFIDSIRNCGQQFVKLKNIYTPNEIIARQDVFQRKTAGCFLD